MAEKLIESMTTPWKPEEYTDEYREALEEMIENKVANGGTKPVKTVKAKRPSNVIDLVSVLQESLNASKSKRAAAPGSKARGSKTTRKSAAAKHPKSRRKAA
jgi:DNA end-binding protein Ku